MTATATDGADAIGRALVETNERLAQIVAVQRDIAAAGLDLRAVMELAVDHARRLTGADGAMINLVDGDDMVVRAAVGSAAPVLGDRRPLSATLLRFAIKAGRPILVRDSTTDPRVNRELSQKVGDRSIICVAFSGVDRVVGSLNVVSSSVDRPLTEAHRETMELVAGMLSAGVSHAAEYEAKRSEVEALGRFQTIFAGAPIGIARIARDRHLVAANPALCTLLGYSEDELGASPFERVTHLDDIEREKEMFSALVAGERTAYCLEKRYVHRHGDLIWAQVHVAVECDADGVPAFGIVMVENITERKLAEEALRVQYELNEHRASHDELTGLANRSLFRDMSTREIDLATSGGAGGRVAVLMADLDNFKYVNDSLGHHAGDVVLQQVGARLVSALRASDTVARLGGDEFAMLLGGIADRAMVETLVMRVRAALAAPVLAGGTPVVPGASIGIAMYPEDGSDVDVLLRRADAAMYLAKTRSPAYAYYDETIGVTGVDRRSVAAEMRDAIDAGGLTIRYVAKCRIRTGEVCAAEALPYWHHPSRGLVSPEPDLDPDGPEDLVRSLVLHTLDRALADCETWLAGGVDLPVSVGVPARLLQESGVVGEIDRTLAARGVPANRLELAVVGSGSLAGSRADPRLAELVARGVRVVVDDVGVGSRGLEGLRNLLAHEIRLGAALIDDVDGDEAALAMVRALVGLGRDLGLDVTARGVATREAWDRVGELGCTFGAGAYVGPELSADEVPGFVAARSGHGEPRYAVRTRESRLAGGTWHPPGTLAARR